MSKEMSKKSSASKKTVIILALILIVILIFLIGPLDFFAHGFYSNVVNYEDIDSDDFLGYVDLSQQDYQLTFTPAKSHFTGFEINLINQPNNTGTLILTVTDQYGKLIDKISVDVGNIQSKSWYKVSTNEKLNKGTSYILTIHAENCAAAPQLQLVDNDYLATESISDNLLIGYAYKDSTFTVQQRILISLLLLVVGGLSFSFICCNKQKRVLLQSLLVFLSLLLVLTWNFTFNSLDSQNTTFTDFQVYSETLVSGPIFAQKAGVDINYRYGLGWYTDSKGINDSYALSFLTDANWNKGYNRQAPIILLSSTDYTRSVAVAGNCIRFANEDVVRISDVSDDGTWLVVTLQSDKLLREAKQGDLSEIVFLDSDNNELPRGTFVEYPGQYGLQGKVFKRLSAYFSIDTMNMLCSLATAFVLMVICYFIFQKYNALFAGVYYVTFLLSPWIVNFANNLYWVEFTWFIPMAIGLFCSLNIHKRICRLISYLGVVASITLKCLCGYEYISTIMMGLIAFLLADFVAAIVNQDRKEQLLLIRTILIIGVCALLGFGIAICMHATIRANGGGMIQGVKNIFYGDVLRRTHGADINSFTGVMVDSLNASTWEVLSKYLHFDTQIITGVPGNLFPMLCLIPIAIFLINFRKKKVNYHMVALYIVFFATTTSWYILAKAHSYVHTHMNYVLWYFGFVQVCLYVIIEKMANWRKNR